MLSVPGKIRGDCFLDEARLRFPESHHELFQRIVEWFADPEAKLLSFLPHAEVSFGFHGSKSITLYMRLQIISSIKHEPFLPFQKTIDGLAESIL
jgi:hypothetical protein